MHDGRIIIYVCWWLCFVHVCFAFKKHARLSHEGVYANLPFDAPLILYMDRNVVKVQNATLYLTDITRRSWFDVQLCKNKADIPSSFQFKSVEACKEQDLKLTPTSQYVLRETDLHGDGGIIVEPNPIPALRDVAADTNVMHSIVITLKTVDMNQNMRTYQWWIAHVSQPDLRRARWPIGSGDYVSRAGEPNRVAPRTWDGLDAARLSGCTSNESLTQ